MKKITKYIILSICLICLTACNNKYQGYWCRYEETATIVILLNENNTESQRTNIEKIADTYDNLESLNYYSKEDYATELGEDVNNIDIYDTYVLTFNTMDSIGTYIEELNKVDGVKNATQSYAKTNMALYNIQKNGKYEFTNSDEANEDDIIKGKYKIKNGVITFTPSTKDATTTLLYIKDGHLCEDADCNKIFAESDEKCSSLN